MHILGSASVVTCQRMRERGCCRVQYIKPLSTLKRQKENAIVLPQSRPFPLVRSYCHGLSRYNETFEFDVSNPASSLLIECWDQDTLSNDYIGSINLPLSELSDGKKVSNLGRGIQTGLLILPLIGWSC